MSYFSKLPHQAYYVVELVVIVSGLFSVYLLSFNFILQTATLALVLIFYALMGIMHHKLHHTLRSKIVIEYFLISILVFACFIFLNIGKI